MANVNSDVLAGIRTNFLAIFKQALGERQDIMADAMKVCTEVPSTAERNTYDWFGMVPPMEEWKDDRKMQALSNYTQTLVNQNWANGLSVDRNAIEDDQLGKYAPRVKALASAYMRRVVYELFYKLNLAASATAYDGTAMCADTRTIGQSANIDNYLSGAYSGSEAEIRTAIRAARSNMAAFQDDYGMPLNLQPDTIVCSPLLHDLIDKALMPDVQGTVRPESKYIKQVVSNPLITSGSGLDWFLLCTSEEVNPLIFQNRQQPRFASLDKDTDLNVFQRREFMYGVDARFTVGYGDPRTLIMVVDA